MIDVQQNTLQMEFIFVTIDVLMNCGATDTNDILEAILLNYIINYKLLGLSGEQILGAKLVISQTIQKFCGTSQIFYSQVSNQLMVAVI